VNGKEPAREDRVSIVAHMRWMSGHKRIHWWKNSRHFLKLVWLQEKEKTIKVPIIFYLCIFCYVYIFTKFQTNVSINVELRYKCEKQQKDPKRCEKSESYEKLKTKETQMILEIQKREKPTSYFDTSHLTLLIKYYILIK